MSYYCQSFLVFLFVLVVMPLSSTKAVDNWGDFDPYADRVEPCPGDGNVILFLVSALDWINFKLNLKYFNICY